MMSMETLRFAPVRLHVFQAGPLREVPDPVEFTTTAWAGDEPMEPTNLLLMCSSNGRGKTTMLEAMAWLMQLLGDDRTESPWRAEQDPQCELQLDVLVKLQLDGEEDTFLLSLVDVPEPAFVIWHGAAVLDRLSANRQVVFGRQNDADRRLGVSTDVPDRALQALLREVRASIGRPPPRDSDMMFPGDHLPVLLFFTSDRTIARTRGTELRRPARWDYQPVRRFDADTTREASLENLLLWLAWQGEERWARAKELLNQVLLDALGKPLRAVDRSQLHVLLGRGAGLHRPHQLSSGEQNLLLLAAGVAAHMTTNTIIVIDELDLHLHPNWERWAVRMLKALLRNEWRGERSADERFSVLFTTHSTAAMDEHRNDRPEQHLRKSAHILLHDFEEPHAED